MQISELKKEMRFNLELLSLIDTLKRIAMARYHSLEREKERFERFMESFHEFFGMVDLAGVEHPLVRSTSEFLGVVAVTSDSGFMGGLNAEIIRNACAAQGDIKDDKVKLIVIGEKGASWFAETGRPFKFFKGIEHETRYEQAIEVADYLVTEVLERRIGRLVMVYPHPVSFSQQVAKTISILPCSTLFEEATQMGKASQDTKKHLPGDTRKVIVESAFSDMAEYLARTWVTARLYDAFEDSKLSEYGARSMHLENSSQKLEKEHKKLQYRFFRAAHEKIDKGMRESYAATNIRKKRRAAEVKAQAGKDALDAA